MKVMGVLRITFFMLLCYTYTESMPTSTSTATKITSTTENPWRFVDSELEFYFCEADFLNFLSIVCHNKYFDGTLETYIRRKPEILRLGFECCLRYCSIKKMKTVCANQGVPEQNKSIQKNITKATDLLQVSTPTSGITTKKVLKLETTTKAIENLPKPHYDIDEADFTSAHLFVDSLRDGKPE